MGRRRRDERGLAAVEFALVAPFVLLLLIGMVSTAFAYSDNLSITNAVREGARYGAAVDYSSGTWATSVRDRVKETYQNDGGTLTDSEICVKVVNNSGSTVSGTAWSGSGCGTSPAAPTTMANGSCAVIVWVTKPATIELAIVPTVHFDISAKSVAYYGRTLTSGCTAS